MKFLNLKIHNLASIEDAEIDFDGSVLRDEPLFLITGATGAGKSTILDAICLALYNETPRFSEAAEKNVKLTDRYNAATGRNVAEKDYKAGEQDIPLNHKGQLLRRGTAEGWVKLTFEDEGKQYLAFWYVKRTYNRADGKLEKPQNSLTDLSTGKVFEKTSALKEVEKVVGLTFDEFCRTTMLAQGEFTRFLQSSSKDKSAILEKLTRTTQFTEIGKKISELRGQYAVEYERKKTMLKGIILFTEEQTAEKLREKDELKTISETLAGEYDTCNKKRKWLSTDSQLASDIEEKSKALLMRKEATETEEYEMESRMVADYEATTEPRAWMADMEQAQRQIQQLKDDESGMAGRYAELVAANTMVAQALDNDLLRLDELETWIGERRDHANMLHDAKEITFRLRQVQNDEESIRKRMQTVEDANNRLPEMDRHIEECQKKEQEASEQLRQKTEDRENTAGKREALDPEGLKKKSKALSGKKDDIKTAMNHNTLLDTKHAHLQETEDAYRKRMDERVRLEEALPGLRERVEWMKKQHEREKEAYDQIRSSMDENIRALRATLRKGTTCPLCLQDVEHDHVPDPDYDTYIRPLYEAEKKSREELEKATTDWKAKEQMVITLKKQEEEARKNWKKAEEQFEVQFEVVRKDLEKVLESEPDMAMSSQQRQEMLRQMEEKVKEELAEVAGRLEEVESIGKQLEQMMRDEKKLTRIQSDAKAATKEAENLKQQLLANVDAAKNDIRLLRDNIDNALQHLRNDISWTGWEKEWEDDHDAFTKRLGAEGVAYVEAEKGRASLQQVIDTRKMTLEAARQSRDDVEKLVPQWVGVQEGELSHPKSETELPRLWNELTNKVNIWKTSLANKEEYRAKKEEMVRAFVDAHQDISFQRLVELAACDKEKVESTKRRHEELQRVIQKDMGGLAQLKQQRERHLAEKPAFSEEETAEWLKAKAEDLDARRKETLKQIGQLEQQLRDDKEKQQKHARAFAECEECRDVLEQWIKLDKELGGADGSRFCRVAQSFILHHLLTHANKYLEKFTNRYELVCEPGALAILVRDRFSRQSPQFAKILSGGESFMVSLSLALALAKLNTNQSSVDTLFIDEGFGTLDEECLNIVMDTLEQLHQMGGHRVGIISHVEALNDRIHAQVQVRRVNPSKSVVEVKRM